MLNLDKETHTYTKDKQQIPGVSRILQGAGLIDFSKVPIDRLEAALNFGTAVHRACELYDKNDLDETSLSEELIPYLNAWKKFRKDTKFKIKAIEEHVLSTRLRFAGTLDRRGLLYDRHVIIDIKSSVDFHPAAAIQTSAYKEAYNEDKKPKDKVLDRYSVLLKPDGNYKVVQYKDKNDFNIFVSSLNLWNWKERNL